MYGLQQRLLLQMQQSESGKGDSYHPFRIGPSMYSPTLTNPIEFQDTTSFADLHSLENQIEVSILGDELQAIYGGDLTSTHHGA